MDSTGKIDGPKLKTNPNKPPTLTERVQEKVERRRKWEAANPNVEWSGPEYEEGNHITIPKAMVRSGAYRSLSKWSMLVLQDFFVKRNMKKITRYRRKVWVIENNGEIVYTYPEAVGRGISRKQFVSAIDELQAKGFIDITHHGKGGRRPAKGTGDCSTYWIDDRWEEYGTEHFKPPKNPRSKDRRMDRGFTKINNDPELKKANMSKQQKARQARFMKKKPSVQNGTR